MYGAIYHNSKHTTILHSEQPEYGHSTFRTTNMDILTRTSKCRTFYTQRDIMAYLVSITGVNIGHPTHKQAIGHSTSK